MCIFMEVTWRALPCPTPGLCESANAGIMGTAVRGSSRYIFSKYARFLQQSCVKFASGFANKYSPMRQRACASTSQLEGLVLLPKV